MRKFLNWLNFYVLQWLFLRLSYETQDRIIRVDVYEVSIMEDGRAAWGGRIREKKTYRRFGLMIGAIPLSGYGTREWRYVTGRPVYLWFTKFRTYGKSV